MDKSAKVASLPQAEVLQDALEAETSRQWWSDTSIPMFGQQCISGDEPDLADEEEEDQDRFAASEGLIFHGLFGTLPDTDTAPVRLHPRRSA